MIDDYKISILSLYPSDDIKNFRIFTIKSKTSDTCYKIRLDHGMIISMCGTTQNDFRQGISKFETHVAPRISLSFRQMA